MARKTPSPSPKPPGGAETPGRLYRQLAERIAELFRSGEFTVGQRLPPERDLAERFQVSRASIREAVIALEIGGFVEVRGGSGIYVLNAGVAPLPESGPGPFELLRARALIEPEIAALCATSAKPSDVDRIHAALNAMAQSLEDKAANEAADRTFHHGIAEGTGNSALVQVVASLWEQRRGEMWSHMDAHFHTPALREASLEDHRRVFLAIVERDGRAARKAMRDHIERVTREFAKGWQRQALPQGPKR